MRLDQEVRDAFRLFDQDRDGKVSRKEIVDLIQSLEGDPTCPHVQVWKKSLIITKSSFNSLPSQKKFKIGKLIVSSAVFWGFNPISDAWWSRRPGDPISRV